MPEFFGSLSKALLKLENSLMSNEKPLAFKQKMNQHYKPPPRKHQTWDILTALLLGVWFSVLAAAYFDILWK
jgi:hypothetical protein